MNNPLKSWSRRIVVVVSAVTFAILGAVPGPAQASSAVADLPVAVKACRLDTGPNYPSCVRDLILRGSPGVPGIVPLDLPLTVKVCKVDTGPNFPSCLPDLGFTNPPTGPVAAGVVNWWVCRDSGHGFLLCRLAAFFCNDRGQCWEV